MTAGLACAIGAAIAYGLATTLQARGAQRAAGRSSALLQPWTLAGTALDGVGIVLALVALRSLPLYVVQAIVAASLAVSAVTASYLLGQTLRPRHWAAVLAVTAGLVLVGAAASTGSTSQAPGWLSTALVVLASATAVAVAYDAARRAASGLLLGVVAGFGFAIYAVAVATLPDLAPRALITSPLAYAAAVAGAAGFVALVHGLERASVATVTAPVVVLETVLPGAVGLAVLGERPAPLALAGFSLAVIGALALADTTPKS